MQFTGESFEDEVRSIARHLFSNSIGQGSEKIDERERDGVFWNGSFYTIVEATIDKTKLKAANDAEKTHTLVSKKRQENFMAQGYVVTLHEPTVDQKTAVKKYEKTTKIISFDELRSMLFDPLEYLRNRTNAPFGSVFDHAAENSDIPRSDFIPPTISEENKKGDHSIASIVDNVKASARIVLTADYGVEKSMALREVFFSLGDQVRRREHFRTPILINLREHQGQDDPFEVLERHARKNGVDPRKLVAAWRAGYVDLLLDGFDELSTRGWTGDIRKLRDYRRSIHKVVRELVKQTPTKSAVIIVGRVAYFDSEAEMRDALGASKDRFKLLALQPFDDKQASEFLLKKGIATPLPEWMPTRPLFLTYLIGKGLLSEAVLSHPNAILSRGFAWYSLIDMIADRESLQLEGVDKEEIKKFLGALAVIARQLPDSRKSFSPAEMERIFSDLTGYTFVEEDKRLILRLPGLGVSADDATSRTFIDDDFLSTCSAMAEFDFVRYPFLDSMVVNAMSGMCDQISAVGLEVLAALLEANKLEVGIVDAAVDHALGAERAQLAYDVFAAAILLSMKLKPQTFRGISVSEIDLTSDGYFEMLHLTLDECLVERIALPAGGLPEGRLEFKDCLIGLIEGRSGVSDLPPFFVDCQVDQFSDDFSVNNSVLSASMPLGLRVLVVTLRKIFSQPGKARLESALLRGLDHRARTHAPTIIELLLRHRFISESGRQGKKAFSGMRAMRGEALAIMHGPLESRSSIVIECRRILD